MAKTTKSEKSDRQKVIDDIRRKQKSAEKRQGFVILAVCIAIALIIVVLAAYKPVRAWFEQQKYADDALADIGSPPSVCGDITTKDAKGSGEHRDENEQITYDDAPPAFGPHWNVGGVAPVPIDDRFYTEDSRPSSRRWCTTSSTASRSSGTTRPPPMTQASRRDQGDRQASSTTATPTTGCRSSPRRGPRTTARTSPTASTSRSPTGRPTRASRASPKGVWQYCSEPSGEALETFMKDYPYYDAPEPIGGYAGSSRQSPPRLTVELRAAPGP